MTEAPASPAPATPPVDVRAELERAARARGLSREELGRALRGSTALASLEAALAAGGDAEASGHLAAVREDLARFRPDTAWIRGKLDRVRTLLEKKAARLPAATVEAFDRRQLDLQEALRPGLAERDLEALLVRIAALEREVDAAR